MENKQKRWNTLFRFIASATSRASLSSYYLWKNLEDRLKHGSVVIACFLGKARDGEEDERAPNYDPAIQFET